MCSVALSLALSACATTERNVVVISPSVPDSLLVCGDDTTADGVPLPPQQPYSQREAAAYVVTLKAYIRECSGNMDAVEKILEDFQKEIESGNLEAEG
jgi:hypothetical protein